MGGILNETCFEINTWQLHRQTLENLRLDDFLSTTNTVLTLQNFNLQNNLNLTRDEYKNLMQARGQNKSYSVALQKKLCIRIFLSIMRRKLLLPDQKAGRFIL